MTVAELSLCTNWKDCLNANYNADVPHSLVRVAPTGGAIAKLEDFFYPSTLIANPLKSPNAWSIRNIVK